MTFKEARSVVVIVTPAWAGANNGNWQTARRWARHLSAKHTAVLVDAWPQGQMQAVGASAAAFKGARLQAQVAQAQAMIALHARRSAASIQAWHAQHGTAGLAVVLTGTDLYKDLCSPDPAIARTVMQSLQAAQRLVVLQDQAALDLPAALRQKAQTLFQSTTARRPLSKADLRHSPLRAVMVGHLREEKDPCTLFEAAALLQHGAAQPSRPQGPGIRIDHLGAALDPALGAAAQATQAACPLYRWVGGCTHEQARRRIQRAHVLVHTSRVEGGAHVIMEALCSGTPVIASRVAGNVGMLGPDYAGYFEVGDAAGLAQALLRFQSDADFRAALEQQAQRRAACFEPAREAQALQSLAQGLVRARVQ
jgi:putative glycosyltransferase (TIGR04348 family)